MIRKVLLLSALLVPGLALTGTARGGDETDRDRHRLRPIIKKDRVCVHECYQGLRRCIQDAREATAGCFSECEGLVAAARDVCGEEPDSVACADAREAARGCLTPCYEELRPLVRECFRSGHSCVRSCADVIGGACVGQCRADYHRCASDVRADARRCRADCSDEREAARLACGDSDEASVECEEALNALHACLEPCRTGYVEGIGLCRDGLEDCLAGCPDDNSPSDDTESDSESAD